MNTSWGAVKFKKGHSLASLARWFDQLSRETKEHIVAVALLAALTSILFAPSFSGRSFSMVGAHMYAQYPWLGLLSNSPEVVGKGYPQTDHAEYFYPESVFETNAIRSGQVPLWFPYSFGGIPLAETSVVYGFFYLPRLIVIPFLEPINQHDVLLFTHFLLAGLGMYALLRCWGCNVFGAIFGGIVWEINGYSAFFLTFEHILFTAAWLPPMMLGVTLAVRRRSFAWAVSAGGALGISVLAGGLMHAYLNGLLVAGWYAFLLVFELGKLIRNKWRNSLGLVSLPLCTAVIAAAISASCWLPLFQWLPYVHRQGQQLETQLALTIPMLDFARALIRPVSASGPAGKIPDAPGLAFTGIVALVLAVVGLVRYSKPVFFLAILGAFSLAFALGVVPLIKVLRSTLPLFSSMHPYTGFYLFCFVVAALAAFGITAVWDRFTSLKMGSQVLFMLWSMALLVQSWQLIRFTWTINPSQPKTSEWLCPETPLIRALRASQGAYRTLPILFHAPTGQGSAPVLTGKIASIYGLRFGSGYENLIPTYIAGIWSTVENGGNFAQDLPLAYRPYFKHDSLPMDLLEKISVGLLVTAPGVVPRDVGGRELIKDGTLKLVYQGPDGCIYKDTRALPRAFVVPHIGTAPDGPAALRMLMDQRFDARNSAIMIGIKEAEVGFPKDEPSSTSFNATANIISDRLNDVEVALVTPRAAVLVLNDSWAPGWKAFVDGVEHPVLRVNYAFRGVIVPAGQHQVSFLYRPKLFLTGFVISAFSLPLICGVLILIRRAHHKAPSTVASMRFTD